ncbi:MAG: heavy-metal-associated domain-containing protein [Myxococcota bacterium]
MAWLEIKELRRLGWIALGLVLAMSTASIARAADVVLRVDGLACPFCAFGIEKKLMNVPAVSGMDIDLDEGKVTLQLREGERLDAAALDGAVADAGFTLRKILVENAIGTLSETGSGEYLLQCSEPLAEFRVRLDSGDALPQSTPIRDPIRVQVTGEVTKFVAEPAPLAVTSLGPVAPRTDASR